MISEKEAREAADGILLRFGQTHINLPHQTEENALTLAQWVSQELASREARRVESEKVEVVFVSELLDDMKVPSTAFGGEGDAEVRLNIYERIRIARRQLSRNVGKEGGVK